MNVRIRNLFIVVLFLFSGQLYSQTPYFTSTEYKKALWMTTRFYGGQRSGSNNWLLDNHLPSGVNASLTGKSFVADADAGYDLSGGWHDCGDHVKFGQTEFYSAYMLLKGYAEFPTGYGDYYAYDYQGYKTAANWNWEGTGHSPNGIPDILDEVKHATDYFIKCSKDASTFYYQVGQGTPDHQLWETSVKMQTESVGNGGSPRVVYKNPADASMPSFCGAALALMSRLYRPYDATYADLCLAHAQYAYAYAKAHPGTVGSPDGGFYPANGNWKDDYASMCTELYFATNTVSYKTEALAFSINKSSGADINGNSYGFDYTNNADIAIYNQYLLGSTNAKTVLNDLVTSFYLGNIQSDGQFNGGNTGWGPTRYNANTAFIVALWQKMNGTSATPNKYIYDNIDYVLGKNSSNLSFVVGFGANCAKHPHHRNFYLVDSNPTDAQKASMAIPAKNAQFGLMVGGTRNPSSYTDQTTNYQQTEGGLDYNACLVGILGYINSIVAPVSASKTPQTISFGAITAKTYGDPNFTLAATASSGLGVTYTSSDPTVATVTSAGVVTIVGAGSTVITASQAGNSNYSAATAVTQTLVVGKASQTITFGAITAKTYGDPNFTLAATASSGLGVTYTSSDPTVATVTSAGVVTIVGAGSTVITASQAGNANYNAATAVTQTLVVTSPTKTNQTITFGAIASKVVGDANFSLTATASSGLAVTYTSSDQTVATITSAGVVTIVGAGSTVITASQAGNTNYNAATAVTQTLVVGKANQTITFGAITSKVVGDASFSLAATASSSLAVTYTSSDPTIATVTAAGVVTIVGAGSTVITASQAGNATYNAATAVTQTLVVSKVSQTITFGAIASKVVGDANFSLAATASSSLAVTYTSSDPTVATITAAGVVTIVGAGSTVITASQAGNATYNAATAVTQTLVVSKASQTITFGAIASKVVGDANVSLTATASSSLAVTYTSSDPSVATVTSAGVVTIVGAGSTLITASQAGNANYNAATVVTQTLVVGKASQTITFGAIASKVVGDANFSLTATASSGLAVNYTSSDPTVATVTSAGVVTIVGAGSTVITASQAGNANYNAATVVTQTFVVTSPSKTNQTITFGAIVSKVVGDANFSLTATASSGLAVTYTSSNTAVATVTSAGVVTIVGAGSTVITASQAGDATYNGAASVTQTLPVTKKTQTVTFNPITGTKTYGDPTFTLTSSSTSGLSITYTTSDPSVATVSSTGVVTIVGAGTVTITATQAGDGTYASTSVPQTIVIGKASQTITFGAIASKVVGDPNFTLTATASSGLAVTYTSSNAAVATVTSAGVVTIVGAGSTVITSSQAGNTNYNSATAVTQTLVVTTPAKTNQTITFGAIASKVVGDANFSLAGTASSGLAVTYTSSNPAVATVTSAGVVTIVGAGSTVITASQAGDATYNAATSVTQTLTITTPAKTNQTITFGAIASKVVGAANFSLTATASSGLAVTYTSIDATVATVTSAGVVTIVGAGSTVITASQAGNTNYNAASSVTQTLTVTTPAKTNQTITFGAIASKVVGDANFSLTATASSGLAVTYTSSNPNVATVTSAGVVTIVGAGSTVITASQAGNTNYNAASSVTQTLTVTTPAKTNQTITFGAIASKVVGDANFSLTATASSGLAVTYTSSNPAVATVTSVGVVTIVGAGSTVIAASQAGDATFNVATAVTQTLTVTAPATAGNMRVISSGSTIVVNNTGTTDIGAALINTSTPSYTFTIHNIGTADLIVKNIIATSGFNATQIFPSGAIAPNATVTFTVTGIPNDASTPRLGTVTVLNNDVNSSPFTINVSARVGTPTGILQTLSNSAIELFPNPTATGYSTLAFNGSFDNVLVTIYSADGSKALVQDFSSVIETSRQLDVQALQSGVYFVEIHTTQGKLVKRLIKQ